MIKLALLAVLVGVFVTGCAPSVGKPTVTGTVTYRERIALTSNAVVTVRISDVSRADAPATVIGEQVIKTEGKQVPIPFAVAYQASDIEEGHRYSMQVRIEDGNGRLIYISDTIIPVITMGRPTSGIEIVVVPVRGS